ncbi:hypothetical protein H6G97_14495 [Nostoc flagelliforme FACHB-838]|uniref:Uncharacterized protein n=1 Tax=Nostoc flagelliforme FACHB-838 TaxID=2692904 RepID=A0ABR8DNQ5_9NOSO|nr:hypothetical protein [Nostoc flagelliforme]MBD2530718.1 hypothetical protein [Nostoc flagelliforme FACHB-838]
MKQSFKINTIEKTDIAGIAAIYKRVQLFFEFCTSQTKNTKISHPNTKTQLYVWMFLREIFH